VVLLVFCLLSRRDKKNLEAYRAMAQQQQNTATPARPPEPYSIQNSSNAPFLDPSRSNTVVSENAPLMYNSGATSSFRSADMESQRQPYGFIPTESVRSGLVKTYGSSETQSQYGELRIGRDHAASFLPQPVESTMQMNDMMTNGSFDRPLPPATTMMMGGTGGVGLPPPPPPQPTMPLPPPPPFNPQAGGAPRPPLMPSSSRPILSYPNLPIDDSGSAAYGGIPAPM
jgi:hypothetical protein